ncbi:MAG: response regulator, partial [Rudaea sp.]
GHTMRAAESGEEGLRCIDHDAFDIIFLDLHMPDRDGWQILADLRDRKRAGKSLPPVVVLSADATPQAMQNSRKLGAHGYLTKQVAGARLLNILEDVSAGQAPSEEISILSARERKNEIETADSFLNYLRAERDQSAVAQYIHTCLTGIEGHLASLTIALAAGDAETAGYHLHCIRNEFLQLDENDGVELCKMLQSQLGDSTQLVDMRPLVTLAHEVKRRLGVVVAEEAA